MISYKEKILPIIAATRSITAPHFGLAAVLNDKNSRPADMVTQLDIDVENHLRRELAVAFPDIGFVGEEEGGDRSVARFWLVDPIDGTANFIRGIPICTTMLALIEEGEVVFSAIYDFVANRLYWAERGKGAYRGDERIRVSSRNLDDAFLCWEININEEKNIPAYLDLLRSYKRTAPLKSVTAGWEFLMVAEGKYEGRVQFHPWGKDYDFAPGSLLVSEAGGIVRNIGTGSYDYRNTDFIAANPVVFEALDALFSKYV